MNAALPSPGTVWLHRKTARIMRVIISEETIILHNCELAARVHEIRMCAWLGTFDQFRRSFRAVPIKIAAAYPKTHHKTTK